MQEDFFIRGGSCQGTTGSIGVGVRRWGKHHPPCREYPIMPEESQGAPTAQELKAALKAFRKRLKLVRLDAESSLGGGPLSGGKRSLIVAISPPDQFPQAVWDELVRQGKLKKAGRGQYELAEE